MFLKLTKNKLLFIIMGENIMQGLFIEIKKNTYISIAIKIIIIKLLQHFIVY